jgi:drug/metabolite transporter (DMT)-like permease
MIYFVVLANVCLLVAGQVFFKWGLESLKGGLTLSNLVPLFLNPWILLGLALYVLATVVWFYVLSKLPLSVAYPLQSFSYVLGLLASRFVLHETVHWSRWAGVLIILIGVAVIAHQPSAASVTTIHPEH